MKTLRFSALLVLLSHMSCAALGTLVSSPDLGVISTPQLTRFKINIGQTPAPLLGSANLERLTNGIWLIVGPLYDDGTHGDAYPNDGIYTTQLLVNESAVGAAQFRVSVAFKGTLLRGISNICTINIAEQTPFSTPSSSLISDGESQYAAGQVIIILTPGFGWSDAQSIAAANAGQVIGFAPSVNSFQLSVPAATTAMLLSSVLTTLSSDSRILSAFPNFQANLSVSNDLTSLEGEQPSDVLAYQAIGLFGAWNYLANSVPQFSPVTVGIIDTGVDASHPAFADVNFGSSSAEAKTPFYGPHGTAVAGIIGAENSNSPPSSGFFRMNGILAGLPGQWDGHSAVPYTIESRLMGDYQSIVSAIDSLALANADVVNISLTINTPGSIDPITLSLLFGEGVSFVLRPGAFAAASAAITSTLSKHPGVIFVVSAGNVNSDVQYATPANITLDNVIVVGGTSVSGGARWVGTFPEASNYGAVPIAAPAEGVYTTTAYVPPLGPDDYVMFDGTSASAPLVTGTVGLMLSVNHELQPSTIKTILASTATPVSGSDQPIGGLLNMLGAIAADPIPPAFSSLPPTASFLMSSGAYSSANGQTLALVASAGGSASVTFSDQSHANNTGGSITSWVWMVNGAQISTTYSFRQQLSIGTYQVMLFVADNTGTFGPGATGVITVSATPPPTGTVGVNGSLDGIGNAWVGGAIYSVGCGDFPSVNESAIPLPPTILTGQFFSPISCTLTFTSGGPPDGRLTAISYDDGIGPTSCGILTLGPTCSATLTRGGSVTFTLQFTTNPIPIGSFVSTPPMNIPRSSHQATVLGDGTVLVTGGVVDASNDPTATAEIYNSTSQTWQFTTSAMSTARADHRAVVMADGRVLIIGGSYSNTAEIYDPTTGQFTLTGSMAVPRDSPEATLLPDGRVIVIGGKCGYYNGCGYYATPTVEIYTPSSGSWSSASEIPVGYNGVVGHRVVVRNGQVLVFAGDDGYSRGSAYNSVFSYDPTADVWTTLTPLNEGLQEPSILLLPDGRVFITGGVPSSGLPTNDTEIYDAGASGGQGAASWGPSLNQGRHVHGLVQLSDGSFLVAGGEFSCYGCTYGVLSSVEYLPSIAGTWAVNGSMNVGRAWFTLTLLANNQAFAVGGVIPDLTITPTDEVWAK